MLAFRRKANEKIYLNDDIVIEVLSLGSGVVKIGIEAPADVRVRRGEHYESPEEETRRSAGSDFDMRELTALAANGSPVFR